MKPIGIPYATAVFQGSQLFSVCPKCNARVAEYSDEHGERTTNHYAVHWNKMHGDQREIAVKRIGDAMSLLQDALSKVQRGYNHDSERSVNGARLMIDDAQAALNRLLDERGGDGL